MDLNDKKSRILLKPLYEAIKENNFEKVHHLLTSCDDSPSIKKLLKFNQVPDKRNNPLNLALKSGSSERILRVLLESGTDPNEHVLHSPFLLAVRRKDLKSLKLFIEYGGNPLKSINIYQTALKDKYYDKEVVVSLILQFGDRMKFKSTRNGYLMLKRLAYLKKGIFFETQLTHFKEVSRNAYIRLVKSTPPSFDSLIPDLVYSKLVLLNNDYPSFNPSDNDYKEMVRLVKLVYLKMNREDRQQIFYDMHHCLNGENKEYSGLDEWDFEFIDRINVDILEMVIEDLKLDFDINSVTICEQHVINFQQNKENLLVCALRYENPLLAEKLIKLGADLSVVQFTDVALINKLQNRVKLIKLLIAAGFRLPHNFDVFKIMETVMDPHFVRYLGSRGLIADFYIVSQCKAMAKVAEKMLQLHGLYTTLVPQHQGSLQSLCRMNVIKNCHPYNLKGIIAKLSTKLQNYLSFNDCEYDNEEWTDDNENIIRDSIMIAMGATILDPGGIAELDMPHNWISMIENNQYDSSIVQNGILSHYTSF